MEVDEERLKRLLEGQLPDEEEAELVTKLDRHPAMRRALADMALESDRTRPDPSIRLKAIHAIDPTKPNILQDVEVGPTLGRGGMALVRLGQQLKLDRSVAVKTLLENRRSNADVRRLLREARITGRLEHPNIVPVHDIVNGDDNVPQVVLKLIEGDTWSRLMKEPETVRERFGEDDLLEWNLGVLMNVCRALSFAHSRRVLHRDVKPSNVMVGPFGEVYLLDWGIALEMDDPNHEDEEGELAGTKAYMAPEQIEADPSLLGPWTDTYLLGATLFHVLTGSPPHSGKEVHERVAETLTATTAPSLPPEVPLELQRIVRKALNPEPTLRTVHPEDFRLEIAAFLQHRAATRLAHRATKACQRAIEAQRKGDDAEVEASALAAEVSYRAALEEWPECVEASEGLLEVAALRIEHALLRNEPAVAARLAEAHPGVADELRARVDAAVAKADDDAERLQRLVTDSDRRLGHRMRGILGALFGGIWVAFWSFIALRPPESLVPHIAFTVCCGVVGVAAVVWRAPQMLKNRINRTSMSIAASAITMITVWFVGAAWRGLDVELAMTGYLFVMALAVAGMANLMDAWGAVSSAGFAIAFLVACVEPAWTPLAVVASHLVLLINQLVLNRVRARQGFEEPPTVRLSTGEFTESGEEIRDD